MIRRRIGIIALALLAVLAAAPLAAAAPLVLGERFAKADLAGHMELLRDEAGILTIEDLERPDIAAGFRPLAGDLAAGFDRSVFWLRVTVQGDPRRPTPFLLEVGRPFLDHVGLYVPDGAGGHIVVRTGDRTPFSTRPLPHRTFVFRPVLPPGGPHVLHLRVQTTSTVAVSVMAWSERAFAVAAADEATLLGMINGFMICITLFSAFQYALKRDAIYLYYVAYILTTGLMYVALEGYAAQYLFPELPLAADGAVGVFVCLGVGAGMMFVARTLDIRHHFPRIAPFYRWLSPAAALSAASVLPGLFHLVSPVIQVVALVSSALALYTSAVLSWRGDRVARYFLAGFLVYVILIGMLVFRAMGVYPAPANLVLWTQLAAVPHMLLLSLGLLQRTAGIDALRLEQSRQAERQQEAQVAQRAAELAGTNAALAVEISVRRGAENRLRESERQLRAILDAAPFPMVVATFPDGVLQFVNQPALELMNIDPRTVTDLRAEEFYADPSERRALIQQLHETGCVLGVELRLRRKPDQLVWTLLSAVRFTFRDQDAVLVCINDISTRKQLEDSLRQANLRSEAALAAGHQAMREQRNFLSMVSHEFRVPLAIIEAAGQLLGIYTRDNGEAQDEVAKIGRAVRRMSDLIDVCLADDRLDSASWSLNLAPVDLGRLVSDLCDDKRPFIGDRDLVVRGERSVLVEADATLLRIGISNLIDNALKFSPPASPVEVAIAGDGEGAMLSVTDHGPGIPLEEQLHIFEKFFRSTRSDRIRGAGLGLYIVRRIVELHDGSIAVNSLPGEGATFVAWLPTTAISRKEPQVAPLIGNSPSV